MKHWIVFACIGMSLCVAGCGKSKSKQAPPAAKQETPQEAQPAADAAAAEPVPPADAKVTVTSSGTDPLNMVNEALKSAIQSVHGQAGAASIDFVNQAVKALSGGDNHGKKSSASPLRMLKDPAFSEQVVVLGKEAISAFSVVSASGPDAKGIYTVSIEVTIPRGAAPAVAAQK